MHAADLHIDSPLLGLDRLEGAPIAEIRQAPRAAFRRLIDTALAEHVNFVVLSGDIFDGPWRDISTGLFFCRELQRLAPTPVFVVLGNHDAANTIISALPWPQHVHRFSAQAAETVMLNELGVAVHGQSFASKVVNDDLAAGFPDAVAHCLNIGVLHTSLGGYQAHGTYAPTSIATLRSKGYDIWCLGHVHEREVVSRDPLILFPGNIQGRHINERGARGCYLIDDHSGTLRERFVELDSLRWELIELDVTPYTSVDDIRSAIIDEIVLRHAAAEGHKLCLRVRLVGASFHTAVLREDSHEMRAALTLEAAHTDTWIESVVVKTHAPREEAASEHELGATIASVFADARSGDAALCERMRAQIADLQAKLPREYLDLYGLRFSDDTVFAEILDEAEAVLNAHLR